jgi:hypothetical protein
VDELVELLVDGLRVRKILFLRLPAWPFQLLPRSIFYCATLFAQVFLSEGSLDQGRARGACLYTGGEVCEGAGAEHFDGGRDIIERQSAHVKKKKKEKKFSPVGFPSGSRVANDIFLS